MTVALSSLAFSLRGEYREAIAVLDRAIECRSDGEPARHLKQLTERPTVATRGEAG